MGQEECTDSKKEEEQVYITDDATEYEPKKPFFFLCLFPALSQCLRSANVKGDTTRDLSSQNELSSIYTEGLPTTFMGNSALPGEKKKQDKIQLGFHFFSTTLMH